VTISGAIFFNSFLDSFSPKLREFVTEYSFFKNIFLKMPKVRNKRNHCMIYMKGPISNF